MKLAVNKIVIDESIYPRSGVNEFNVHKLVSALKTGVKLPPLTVEAKTYRLVDGRHRLSAFTQMKIKTIDVTEKVYASEADLFADAVRLNVGHGQQLDQYSVRKAIVRLTEYGYHRDQISDVVRLPAEQIEKIERGFAIDDASGKPVALKGGLRHLAGQTLTAGQLAVNRHYSGPKATFYVNQLCEILEQNMWPDQSAAFRQSMDRLVKLWEPHMADDVPLVPDATTKSERAKEAS